MTDRERCNHIEARLAKIEPRIKHLMAQKNRDWDLFHEFMDERQKLEEDRDAILRAEQHEKDLQEIADWYDDEKNHDAYTMSIIDLEFSDVS